MDFTELQDDPFPFFKTGFVRIPIGLVNAHQIKGTVLLVGQLDSSLHYQDGIHNDN